MALGGQRALASGAERLLESPIGSTAARGTSGRGDMLAATPTQDSGAPTELLSQLARNRELIRPASWTGEETASRPCARSRRDASIRLPVRRAPAADEQRASRGAVGWRLLWWQSAAVAARATIPTYRRCARLGLIRRGSRVASSRPHYTSSGFIGSSRTGPGAGTTSTSSRSMECDSRSSGRRSRRLGGRDRRCPHARPSPAARRGARGYGNSTTNTRLLPNGSPLDPTHSVLPFSTDDLATS